MKTARPIIAAAILAVWPSAARAQRIDVLRAFAGTNAAFSKATLIQGTDGRFYRTSCPADGSTGDVFVLTATGDATLLHQFDGNTEGRCPNALVHASDGNLYGTTQSGGASDAGTIFRLTLTGGLTILHTFTGAADGGAPQIGLIEAPDGTLYGMTTRGGAANLGTVYRYDGDGRIDVAGFTGYSAPSWQIRLSSTGVLTSLGWGGGSDTPVPGDYDADGKTDVVVFRQSTGTWHIRLSGSLTSDDIAWGGTGDIAVPADYDGDGKADVAVFRPSTGTWYIRQSRTLALAEIAWGGAGDIPAPGDFDGDHVTDIAVFRPSTGAWYIRQSLTLAPLVGAWAVSGDIPVVGDYDGDGRSDVAVFRPVTGTWHIAGPDGPGADIRWGAPADIPLTIPNYLSFPIRGVP